ncbi:MAG: dihydroorotate dehydrogenase-like protein [Bacteroidales bacterium]|nr:dihydroorotate dehydrogenase-like protein [Bacteroidales bacterium]
MANLSTSYMGMELKNPLIVGSSGLTNSVKNVKEIEEKGAGAVVLKSLFEEQIRYETSKTMGQDEPSNLYPEALDYISNYSRKHKVDEYLDLIKQCKKEVSIPVIASINCYTSEEWIAFAKQIEEAGADALELNVFILPSDFEKEGKDNEAVYFDILDQVKKKTRLPVALKISYYFSSLSKTTLKLSWAGADAIVLFNRFFSPDIDIDNLKVKAGHIFSTPEELSISLRWVAMLSDRLHCDVAASTGIHDGKAAVKQLLAGAKAVQVASTLYKNGFDQIPKIVSEINEWLDKHNYENLADVIGKMSYKKTTNPAAYERAQFMKHFAGIE